MNHNNTIAYYIYYYLTTARIELKIYHKAWYQHQTMLRIKIRIYTQKSGDGHYFKVAKRVEIDKALLRGANNVVMSNRCAKGLIINVKIK